MGCACYKFKNLKETKMGNGHQISLKPAWLTAEQTEIIRRDWQTLKLHVANLGVITFVSMFESRPELKELYSKFHDKDIRELKSDGLLQQHALRVMATVDKCITRIDEPESFVAILKEVGLSHRNYNVPAEYIKIILPHFLIAIKPHMGDEWTNETSEAWKTLFSLIVFYIEEGMANAHDTKHSSKDAIANRP